MKSVFRQSLCIVISTAVVLAGLLSATPGVAAASAASSTKSSLRWSGYAATGHKFNEVQGTFKVPKISCSVPNVYTFFWVGLGGFVSQHVEQAGVAAHCSGGKAYYYAWTEMAPAVSKQLALTVSPSDYVTVTVNYVPSAKQFKMEVDNTTTGQHRTKTTTCSKNKACDRTSAEWIVERPLKSSDSSASYPLAKWWGNGVMSLYKDAAATTTSKLQPISAYKNTRITMNDGTRALVTTSALAPNGKSFKVTWHHAK